MKNAQAKYWNSSLRKESMASISPINTDKIRSAINKATDVGIPVVTTMNFDIPDSEGYAVGQDTVKAGRIAASLMGSLLSGQGRFARCGHRKGRNDFFQRGQTCGVQSMIEEYPNIEIMGSVVIMIILRQ